MPSVTLFVRSAEVVADRGPDEFAFKALTQLSDAQKAGQVDSMLALAGFPFGAIARVRLTGKMDNPDTGDSQELELHSEPVTLESSRSIVQVVRGLLREHMVLPQVGNPNGIKNSPNAYYASNVTIEWDEFEPDEIEPEKEYDSGRPEEEEEEEAPALPPPPPKRKRRKPKKRRGYIWIKRRKGRKGHWRRVKRKPKPTKKGRRRH